MPDQKLLIVCERITREQDPKKFSELIDELSKLLSAEQETIKAKVAARLGPSSRKAAS